MSEPLTVLFLCTDNSARSLLVELRSKSLAELALREIHAGESASAGARPNV